MYHFFKDNKLILLLIPLVLLGACGKLGLEQPDIPAELLFDRLSVPVAPQNEPAAATQRPSPSLSSQYTLAITAPQETTVERYGMLELDLQTDLPVSNPYDPGEIDLRVQFTSPSGKVLEAGAFWYQGYDQETRQAAGRPGWQARFTPTETGLWTAVACAPALGLYSQAITFEVIPSTKPGFIRIHPENPNYLAYDNGDFFFPIGLNMAWCRGCSDPIDQYKQWLDHFSANGGNTIRLWMAAWSFGIEWKDTGLGDYDGRQYEAWMLDQVFSLAGARGVKIILVLVNHGPFSLVANSEWDHNPYNAALGGPLDSPEQFVTDPLARSYFQRRLSYIVNRWGYSPDLLAWEWFNEVDLTPISDEALVPWLQEMTAYLRQRDVNQHLTTNSFAVRSWSPVWQLPELDIVQRHEYTNPLLGPERDLAGRVVQDYQAQAQASPDKPILLGEFAYSAIDYGDDIEKTGIHLHNGIWATTFSGYAGSGMYWWWDNYIEKNELWKHFNSLSGFLEGEDLTHYRPFTPLVLSAAPTTEKLVDGLGLRGEKTMLWLRNDEYTAQAAIAAQNSQGGASAYQPALVENLHIVVDGLADGEYTVSWYDPQSSEWREKMDLTSRMGILTVPVPPFRFDLAVKIVRNPSGEQR